MPEELYEPLNAEQLAAVRSLLGSLTPDQLLWLHAYVSGYVSGRLGHPRSESPARQASSDLDPGVLVLFGSQTGNAEKVARQLAASLAQRAIRVRIESMGGFKTAGLKRESRVLIVVSTHGDGDPPDNARPFHEFLFGKRAPQLSALSYAVLALGDSSYEHFCKTGADFDTRLSELGASRLLPRVDCDVDYEVLAVGWIDQVVDAMSRSVPERIVIADAASDPAPTYTKQNPYAAPLIENLRLTGRGSTKDVRHIVLSLEGSGLRYEPGDALGVRPSNWPDRVGQLIDVLGLDPAASVPGSSGTPEPLQQVLLHDYEITTITRPFLERYAALIDSAALKRLLEPGQRTGFREYLQGREIIDVIRDYPVDGIDAGQFVALLRKLPHRLYSIASSYRGSPDEVHLTVAVVRYQTHGLARHGVASTYLADRVDEGASVPIFVSGNPNFRLPEDPDIPIIMVGPGTGVAPFRAFVAEREAVGATGRNWLFFGDRNFQTDFLYQTEWLDYRAKGLLNRIDVAFSRDTSQKVYVQHRLKERSRDVYDWLEQGAHFYVCGDGQQMAADVHTALIESIAEGGGFEHERAVEYVADLQAAHRYQRDVY